MVVDMQSRCWHRPMPEQVGGVNLEHTVSRSVSSADQRHSHQDLVVIVVSDKGQLRLPRCLTIPPLNHGQCGKGS